MTVRPRVMFKLYRVFCALGMLLGLLIAGTSAASATSDHDDAVYLLSNAAAGNAVMIFSRADNGTLKHKQDVATSGNGNGGALGSQGSLVLSKDGDWLFAVNAGSNTIASFEVRGDTLRLRDTISSGGLMPISLTVHDDLLFVLNAGGSGNISGFSVDKHGKLSPIISSNQPLSNNGVGPAPGPAQIQFSNDGDTLVVTEKATNLIDTFRVKDNGRTDKMVTYPSSGAVPFGFAIDKRDHVLISEAGGGPNGGSALSSYKLDGTRLKPISASAPTQQNAACWVVVTKNARYAYTANAASNTISSFRLDHDGHVSLVSAVAGTTGAHPTDMDLSTNDRFLYVLNSTAHTISGFRVGGDGRLKLVETIGELPESATGMAAS